MMFSFGLVLLLLGLLNQSAIANPSRVPANVFSTLSRIIQNSSDNPDVPSEVATFIDPSASPTIFSTRKPGEPTENPTIPPSTMPSNPSAAPTLKPTAAPTAVPIPWVKTSALAYLWEAIASDASGQYLVASERSTLGIWTSADYGDNWVRRFTLSGDGTRFLLSSDASGRNLVASGNAIYAYVSRDFGFTWTLSDSPSANWRGLASDASGQQVVMNSDGESGLMYISHNFGQNWTLTSAPAGTWSCVTSSASGQYLVASMDSVAIYTSNDYGVTWVMSSSMKFHSWITLASDATGQYVAGGEYYFFTSNNYGVTFIDHPTLLVYFVCSDSSGANLAVIPRNTDYRYILLSTDYGKTWSDSAAPRTVWRTVASDASGKRLVAGASAHVPGIWTYHNNLTSPSVSPTIALTRSPTTAPVLSTTPTCASSLEPTSEPTTATPTVHTANPTVLPSAQPSVHPSQAPVTAVTSSEPTVTAAEGPTAEKILGVGEIVCVALFGAVFLALCVWLCIYFRRQTALATTVQVADQGLEMNSINENPMLYNLLHTATVDNH